MQEPSASNATPPAPPVSGGPARTIKVNKIIYRGQTGPLYGLWLKQLFLTILTLGVYHFWGKTNLRRYLFGAMELDGDRLEYLGTGKELFIGFAKILPFFIAVIVASVFMEKKFGPGTGNIIFLPIVFLIGPMASYSGFRYRVNRISWRGIRGVMKGSALAYGGKYLLGSLLSFVTLGLMTPSVDLKRWEYQVKNMQFGNVPYGFKVEPARLRKVNIVTLLLFIPTLGIARVWYQAALQREKLRGLSLGNVRFRSTATAGNLMGLYFGNFFLILLTLGIGFPLTLKRNMKFYERFFAIGGDLQNFNAQQEAPSKPGDAEGLLDVLNVDLGMFGA